LPLHLVALSANAIPGNREKCFAIDMDDYLNNPLAPRNARCLRTLDQSGISDRQFMKITAPHFSP
jgi:CheY-like chemotaxis protein